LNQLGFKDPNSINSIEAAINLKASRLDNSNTDFAGAQIEGFFYDDASGSVWAGIEIAETDNGLEASYGISDGDGGTLPITIQYNTEYIVKIEYNELTNEFKFAVNNVSEPGAGPPRVGPSTENWKALTTGIWGDGSPGGGYTSATFDDVRINNEPMPYDDFSTAPLDATKWQNWTLEHVREIPNGKLRLNVQADGERQTVTIKPVNQFTTFLEAKILVESGSQVSAGASGITRIAGYYHNESGPPYNGFENDVWVSCRIVLSENHNLTGWCGLWRHDNSDPWGPGTELFRQDFPTPSAFDTEHNLSIEQKGSTFFFKFNNETYQYGVNTPMHEPSGGQKRYLQSRVYADPGESGYIKTNFDDVYVYAPGAGPAVRSLLLD